MADSASPSPGPNGRFVSIRENRDHGAAAEPEDTELGASGQRLAKFQLSPSDVWLVARLELACEIEIDASIAN